MSQLETWSEFRMQNLRLAILKTLNNQAGRPELNDSLLQAALKMVGHRVTRADLKEQLRWLEGQNLLTLEYFEDVVVAHATERGLHLVEGELTVDGVAAPKRGR